SVAGQAGQRRDRGDEQQRRRPGDRVVDPAGHSGVPHVRGRQHGRGERRHHAGQAQREDHDRGQIFWASAPARADSSSIRSVTGTIDAPAAIGEYPATTCSVTTNRKNTTPIPPYTTNVTRLTAVNSFDANTSSRIIACGLPVRVRSRSV